MAMHEVQGLSGRLTIELRDPDGRVVISRRHDNLITTTGQTLVAQLFTGETAGKPDLFIAVGDGDAKETPQDTALQEELERVAASTQSVHLVTENGVAKASVVVTAKFPALGDKPNQVLREAGILVCFPNRNPLLYNRVTFPEITRTANLGMTLTWEVLF
jgi:hypothetical protein